MVDKKLQLKSPETDLLEATKHICIFFVLFFD